jgi:hypothetical protein
LPRRVGSIVCEIPLTAAVAPAHAANSLKILERSSFGPGYFFSIEVKRCHPAQQKVGRARTELSDAAKFGSGQAEIFGHTLHVVFPAAFQFQCRTPSGPISPPLQKSFGQEAACSSGGQG